MNLSNIILILTLVKFTTAKRNVFDQILNTFEGEIERVHCVILMKTDDGGIPFGESTSIPIINMNINNLPDDIEPDANIIGGHYGNELKKVSKYEECFDHETHFTCHFFNFIVIMNFFPNSI